LSEMGQNARGASVSPGLLRLVIPANSDELMVSRCLH
jgi:hypothetical protein